MSEQEPSFTPDAPKVTPEGIIEELIRHGIKETLGEKKDTLYIGVKKVGKYDIEDWSVYIWIDQRGRENSIFISPGYVSESSQNHEVSWYRAHKEVAKTMIKIPNQRDFIERCVLRQITPESFSSK